MNRSSSKIMLFLALFLCTAVYASDLPRIAVYVTGEVPENEKRALGTMMLSTLVNSGRYRGIERNDAFLDQVAREHETQRSGAIDDSQISALGRQFGVRYVCVVDLIPAFGSFQLSARIVDVETAVVVHIGEAFIEHLNSANELRTVSNEVIQNMFSGQVQTQARPRTQQRSAAPATQTQQPTYAVPQQQQVQVVYHHQAPNFTGGQRFGTWALNFLVPGLGSFTIMRDNVGGWIQVLGAVAGYAMVINGFEENCYRSGWYEYCETEPTGMFWAGYLTLAANGIFNISRSISYDKPASRTAQIDNTGLRLAVFPDRNGELKTALLYRMEF